MGKAIKLKSKLMNESGDLIKLRSKLNDGNLNRQRKSGLTIYAIIGAILILCLKIPENTEIYKNDNFSAQIILITLLTIDICFLITVMSISSMIFIERPINIKIIIADSNLLSKANLFSNPFSTSTQKSIFIF